MTIKKLLKKYPNQFSDNVTIVDLPNHISFEFKLNNIHIEMQNKYFRKLLKRKVDKIFKNNDDIILEIQVW